MTRAKWTIVNGIVICVLCVIGIQQASLAPEIAFDILGSATVPRFVSVALLILVVLMLVEEFVFDGPSTDDAEDETSDSPEEIVTILPQWGEGYRTFANLIVFILYLLSLEYTPVPFWLATFVSIYLCSRILEGGLGRGQKASLIIAIIIAGSIDVIFTNFLLIDLP